MSHNDSTRRIRHELGRAMATATRAMIDVLEVIEEESERIANTRRPRSTPRRAPSAPPRPSPEARRWRALGGFMGRLEQRAVTLTFTRSWEHHLELRLHPNHTVDVTLRRQRRTVSQGFGEWTLHESDDGARIDVRLERGEDGALWVEADRQRPGDVVVTVTRGLFDFANADDTHAIS